MSKEIVIRLPEKISPGKIAVVIDRTTIDLGLTMTMRGTLKSFPGCTHWHLKRDRGRGTLEITWWPHRRKLWIKIQSGRTAAWIDEIAPRFKREIETRLGVLARSM
ncbi:MAG TPA: hypothetical protein VHX86_19725 [Tepidisphaeraceae bacterium]|nr:hypothetical protein [Tepidisphaeraceae bacterium]